MKFYSICLSVLSFTLVNCEPLNPVEDEGDDSQETMNDGTSNSTPNPPDSATFSTTTEAYFSEMPPGTIVKYIDAATLLQFDNKGEKMMGVSDEKCDNARVSKKRLRNLDKIAPSSSILIHNLFL
jgi:hypothetical protein